MLFELEEGDSHKFYRIERIGTRVELHWGRIGTEGQNKTLEHATEAEAERAYLAEIERRRERGYRQVVDESVARDADEARSARLAASGAGTKYPRFLFAKRYVRAWVELRGLVVATDRGEQTFPDAKQAMAARDRAMAALVRDGYVLEDFGKVEKSAAATRAPRIGKLKSHPELEAELVANPHDAGAWLVYEDWLLAERDPRAAIVEAERANDKDAIFQARQRLASALYGKVATKYLQQVTSRAGMLLAATFAPKRKEASICAELAASVGARTLAKLVLQAETTAALVALAPLAALVELDLSQLELADAAPLAAFPRLARLRAVVPSVGFRGHACLAQLTHVELRCFDPIETLPVFARATHLRVNQVLRDEPGGIAARFPAIIELIVDVAEPEAEIALEQLLSAPLPPGLRRVCVGGWNRHETAAEVRAGTPFAQLEHLEVPPGWYRRNL
jgi:uncharacterized protein (TIGR02996 family)